MTSTTDVRTPTTTDGPMSVTTDPPTEGASTTTTTSITTTTTATTTPEVTPERNRGGRAFVVGVFVALASCLIAATSGGLWLRDTVLDTDRWVAAVGSLPDDERVSTAVSDYAAAELLSVTDAEARIESALRPVVGDDADLLGPPIVAAVEPLIRSAANDVVRTDEFRDVWREVNRLAHEEAVLLLRGDGDAITSADGTVQLNLLPIINSVLASVSTDASQLFGENVEIPQLSPADLEVPADTRRELETMLGVDLPVDFGVVTVYDDDRLANVQRAVRWTDDLLIGFGIGAVLAVAIAVGLSRTRRRTVGAIGVGVAIAATGLYVAADVIENDIVKHVTDPNARRATDAVIDVALLRGLEGHLGWTVVAALLVAAGTWLLGPGRREEAAAFVARNSTALQGVGYGLAALALVGASRVTWGVLIATALVLTGSIAAIRAIARHAETDDPADEVTEPRPVPQRS